jgi:outer membrane protein assembly factor BamB
MRSSLILLVTLSVTAAIPAADNWPQFRGPQGAGHSDATGLPVKWSETENVVWKTPIHDKGWSSPVVWGEQIWLTTAREDGKAFYVLCVDRAKGKILHDIKLFDVEKPEFCIAFNSYASPTPVIEEGRVYVHFGTYGTICLDTSNGKKLWERRDLHCDHFRGPGSSPILYDDLLIVHFDGFDAQYVVALNKKTGDTVWKKDRSFDYDAHKVTNGDNKKAYCTPVVVTVKDRPQLISPAALGTIAYDPKTGAEIWKVYHGGMNVAQPPQIYDGTAILCTGDGPRKLLAVRLDGSGDVTKTHIVWATEKAVTSRTAPLLIDDKLYLVNESGSLSCVVAKSGELLWKDRVRGSYSASPLYADGKLYAFNQDGESVVGEVGKEWKELSVNKLDDGCMATPAIAGKALFIRTKTHLYRIEQKK